MMTELGSGRGMKFKSPSSVYLSTICTDISYGYTASAEKVKIGPKFLRITDIQGGVVSWTTVPYCQIEKLQESKYRLEDGDIVVARTGNSTGENYIFTGHENVVFASYLIRFRVNKEIAHPHFVWYHMRSVAWWNFVNSAKTGSAQAGANAKVLGKFELTLPPLTEQIAIASFLQKIDNRITLLRETNTTLDAIAQALFKSWFIDFDPVHAKADGREPEGMDAATAALFPNSFEESELGLIPKGWQVGILDDIAKTVGGQKQTKDFNSDVNYVGLEHMPRNSLGLFEWGTAEGLASAKSCFSLGDILFGKLRPYFHKVVIAPFDGVCSTDILVCQSKKISFYGVVLMNLFSNSLINYASRLSNGAKMPRINWKDLAIYPIILPPEQVAESYSISIQPLLERMKENTQQAKVLATLRDILLPRLISGQLCLSKEEAKVLQHG